MSLNDVYSEKYTPNPKSEALEYIDSILHEEEEKIRNHHRGGEKLRIWKNIHAKLASGGRSQMGEKYNEHVANNDLARKGLPLLEDDYEPSEDNLVQWMVQDKPLKLDYNLLSAIRDACGEKLYKRRLRKRRRIF
ncbi:hypothetical protein N9A45_00405 [bacterium]|nr:hypothetical protein [bacterium]